MRNARPKPKLDYSRWLTKQQAAEVIGCSTKFIELLAQQRAIQMVKWKRPEGGPRINVYHPSDVEALRKKRNPDQAAFVVPAKETKPAAAMVLQQIPDPGQVQVLGARILEGLTSQTSQNVRIAERLFRLFLTLREAAEYSGLPKAHILRLLKDKTLAGMKTGLGWRIPRAALEHYAYMAGNEVPVIEIPKDFQASADAISPAAMS